MPGITSPAITWEFVAERLQQKWRVITVDQRGRGLSDKPKSGYRLADYVGDALGVIESVCPEPPVVIGHSMGGRVAMSLGAQHSDAVAGLVIVDPPLSGPQSVRFTTPIESYLSALDASQRGSTASKMAEYFPRWAARELRIRADWLATCRREAIVESHTNLSSEDVIGPWSRISAPTLLVYGDDSEMITPDQLDVLRRKHPLAACESVEGAGHMVPWDNLAEFLAIVNPFISNCFGS